MNWIVEALLRPSDSRYYTTKKAHKIRLIIEASVMMTIGAFIGFLTFSFIGLVLGIITGLSITLIFDFVKDKLFWPLNEAIGFKKHTNNITSEELIFEAKKTTEINKN